MLVNLNLTRSLVCHLFIIRSILFDLIDEVHHRHVFPIEFKRLLKRRLGDLHSSLMEAPLGQLEGIDTDGSESHLD